MAYRNAFLWFFLALFVIGAGIYPMRSFLGHVDTAALQSFPAFAHALLFTYLLSFRAKSHSGVLAAALAVLVIVSAFEILQQDSVHIAFNHWLPSAVKNYAAHGTFDAQDLLAGALGCLIAGLMSLRLLTK